MAEAVIRVEKLVHVYPRGNVKALKGIDLDINKGDVVSIVGQNGSGKTTLVRHFNGLLRPTEGKVYLMGEDSTGKSVAEMSRRCGYVFQNPNHQIFCTTVREELMVAPKYFGFTQQQADESLKMVSELMGLEHLLDKHPMTLDYTTKKIITIASVLIFAPEVLVLDEPTGGLDEVGREMLTKIIRLMHDEGHTVVIISHGYGLCGRELQPRGGDGQWRNFGRRCAGKGVFECRYSETCTGRAPANHAAGPSPWPKGNGHGRAFGGGFCKKIRFLSFMSQPPDGRV